MANQAESISSTDGKGSLLPISIDHAFLRMPGPGGSLKTYAFYSLPEVSDSKNANYSDIQILGRSSPVKTYSGSDYRSLSVTFNLHGTSEERLLENLEFVRGIASLTHPQYENTYLPPPVAKLKIGEMVRGPSGGGVDVICMNYSYDMSPEVVWVDKEKLIPLHIALRADFHVVYAFFNLPGSQDVIGGNY